MSQSPKTHPAMAAEPRVLVHLIGGPMDGAEMSVPAHSHEFRLCKQDHSYAYSPHYTAALSHLQRPVFASETLHPMS